MTLPSKKIIIPIAAVAVLAAGAYGISQASAAADAAGTQGSLVQQIADTFHLDKAQVQAVFDQHRQQNEANREKNYEDRLAKAVTDGKLTSAQKDAVLAEHNKLKSELDAAMQNTDKTARRTAMDNVQDEAVAWAKSNNIDAKWLAVGGPAMGPGHRGMGRMMRHDRDGDEAPTSSPAPSASPSATPNTGA